MTVLASTRASFNRCVSVESLKGICCLLSCKHSMTRASAERDLLMCLASSSALPCAPLCAILSDPAKSMRKRRLYVTVLELWSNDDDDDDDDGTETWLELGPPPAVECALLFGILLPQTSKHVTQCDRDECSFISVLATALTFLAISIASSTCSSV